MTRWHRPGARPVDRARDVARTCWQALEQVDPAAARVIAHAAHLAGETWLVPQIARHQPDDLITVPDAAELVGRSVRWVYGWVAEDRDGSKTGTARAIPDRDGRIRVRVATILEAVAENDGM
jgi:hypothetical protein